MLRDLKRLRPANDGPSVGGGKTIGWLCPSDRCIIKFACGDTGAGCVAGLAILP